MGTWFSKVYDPFMKPLERGRLGELRKRLVEQQEGVILEIGSGTGANFSYYRKAEKVIATEPDPYMREIAEERSKEAHVPIEVMSASGEALPFADNSFDAVVATLVLCTIPAPERALGELRRVLKPGATALFLEHVRLQHAILGPLQDTLTPLWKRLCDGCHLNRNTVRLIDDQGFQLNTIELYYKNLFVFISASNLLHDTKIARR